MRGGERYRGGDRGAGAGAPWIYSREASLLRGTGSCQAARATSLTVCGFPVGCAPGPARLAPRSPTREPTTEPGSTAARRSVANSGDWTGPWTPVLPRDWVAQPRVPFPLYTNYPGMVVVVSALVGSACATSGPQKSGKPVLSHPQPQDSSAPALHQYPGVAG